MADNWWDAAPVASTIDAASDAEGASPQVAALARSVYQQESGSGSNTKTSNQGAVGGMQIKPSTFSSVADKGWDINDPMANARAGVRYLQKMYEKAGGDPALAAAGYYGGPGAIDKARQGIAVSDPKNPKAPNTLQYGQQVAARAGQGQPQAQGDNWWDAAPAVGQDSPQASQDPSQGDQGGHVWNNIINGVANAVAHPVDTAVNLGSKAIDGVKDLGQRYMDDPMGTMDNVVRGAADAMTFGYADKAAAAANAGTTDGDAYDQALAAERAKDQAGGSAFTAGQLGSVLLPGGAVSIAGKAVDAVPVASRIAKVAAGTGAGAAEGVAQYAGHNDGDFNLSDASAYGTLGALGGAAVGGVAPHTIDQRAQTFLNKAGGDVDGAQQAAEITKGLQGLSQRATQNGVPLGPADANALASKYTQDAANAIRQLPKDADRQTLLNALNSPRALSDTDIAALRSLPNGDAVADAITMRNRAIAMTSATPVSPNNILGMVRTTVDNGGLGAAATAMGHPGLGFLLNAKSVRDPLSRLLGGRENRTGNIGMWLKQGDNADAFLQKYGASGAAQSAGNLPQSVQQTLQAQQAAQQAAQAQSQANQAAQAQQAQTAAQQAATQRNMANSAKVRQQQQVWRQQQQQQTQQVAQQAMNAQQARQAASAQNLQNSVAVRQSQAMDRQASAMESQAQIEAAAQQAQQAQAARQAAIDNRTQSATQDRMAANQAQNQARVQATQQASTDATNATQQASIQDLARKAADKQRREARLKARVSDQTARNADQAKLDARQSVVQAQQDKVNQLANGDYTGLNPNNPFMTKMLSYVDHPGMDEVKKALSDIAAKDPRLGADAANLMDARYRKQVNFYPLQEELQNRFGSKTPEGALSQASGAPAAASPVANKQAYEAGIQNRQKYAADTLSQAPEGPVKELVAKMATSGSEDLKRELYNAVYAKANPAEKAFMDRKVSFMIDYEK